MVEGATGKTAESINGKVEGVNGILGDHLEDSFLHTVCHPQAVCGTKCKTVQDGQEQVGPLLWQEQVGPVLWQEQTPSVCTYT